MVGHQRREAPKSRRPIPIRCARRRVYLYAADMLTANLRRSGSSNEGQPRPRRARQQVGPGVRKISIAVTYLEEAYLLKEKLTNSWQGRLPVLVLHLSHGLQEFCE